MPVSRTWQQFIDPDGAFSTSNDFPKIKEFCSRCSSDQIKTLNVFSAGASLKRLFQLKLPIRLLYKERINNNLNVINYLCLKKQTTT